MLKNKYFFATVFVAILATSGALMVWAALHDSAIVDELAHIPAGYGYIKYFDARLNPEHPPLLKALSAVPLLFIKNLNFPTTNHAWSDDVNSQWEMGADFLYKSGNNADEIIFLARIFPILLTLLTTIVIFIWSREILGKAWALLVAFLFAFSPNVLAHSHYVTTDIAATFGLVFASYFFFKALHRKSKTSIVVAGLALGVAELMKFSMVLLIPYFMVMAIFFGLSEGLRGWRLKEKPIASLLKKIFKPIGKTAAIFFIALLVIWGAYTLVTIHYPQTKQTSDTKIILTSFPTPLLSRMVIDLTKNKLTRPIAQYILGVCMVIQRSAGGNTNYFLSHVSNVGSWYYFPIVYLLKEPLPALLIIFGALIFACKNILGMLRKGSFFVKNSLSNYFGTRFTEFGMLFFIVAYWLYSMKSPLNIGLRHILPTVPFIYILAVSGIRRWSETISRESSEPKKSGTLARFMLVVLLLWFGAETAFAAPYFLSYFNELGGGVHEGYRFVTDSNYDWGQDLKELQTFVKTHNVQKIAVDYFGGGSPEYYLKDAFEPWQASRGNPKDIGIEWLAVSINTLQGSLAQPSNNFTRKSEDEYLWLYETNTNKNGLGNIPKPDFRAGTSIFIYHL